MHFQGLSAGVFIYVIFCEILLDKLSSTASSTNIMSVFVGFAIMALLGLLPHSPVDEHQVSTPQHNETVHLVESSIKHAFS